MKKLLTLLALTISFSVNAQISTEGTNNTGSAASAIGYNTTASGDYSTAMGAYTEASGNFSTAMGIGSIASGLYSTAIGGGTDAIGDYSISAGVQGTQAIGIRSFAFGDNAVSSAEESFAFGESVQASGDNSFSFGQFNEASGTLSVAIGSNLISGAQSSTALGYSTSALGNYSTAMGLYSIASGDYSVAIGYGALEEGTFSTGTPYYKNEAIGIRSHVIGNRNKSTGSKSFSIGNDNLSQGIGTFSLGENNISTGDYSTAIGLFSESIGKSSFAFGNNAYADGFNTTAIGVANTIDENASPDVWSANNRLLVVGNGQYNEETQTLERSDAFTIMFNGDATLAGELTAYAFIGDGSQLTNISSGPFSFNEDMQTAIQSPWSTASGNYSNAFGNSNIASGYAALAMGSFSEAIGQNSVTIGGSTKAIGNFSTAIGNTTLAEDLGTTAIGYWNSLDEDPNPHEFSLQNTAFVIGNGGFDIDGNYIGTDESRSDALKVLFDGTTNIAGEVTAAAFIGDGSQLTNLNFSSLGLTPFSINETPEVGYGIEGNGGLATARSSFSVGEGSQASWEFASSIGFYSVASGPASFSAGWGTQASGSASTSMGYYSAAEGSGSTAFGNNTISEEFNSFVIGNYNTLSSNVELDPVLYSQYYNAENRAFVIGNGTDNENRSDAFVVKFNGDATLAGNLSVNSDANLKSNIISLGSTLAKVLMLDGKSYSMKNDPQNLVKIGLVAQDIEQAFPELVSESNGIKSVNYQGLIPVLINAVKEQDEIIKKQDERLAKLEQVIAKMNE